MKCAARAESEGVMPTGKKECVVGATCNTERTGRIVVPHARSEKSVGSDESNVIAL